MEIVNDQYWLKYAKSSIEKSLSSRNAAAANLEKMTLWFWGLYTASFTIGVSINIIDAPIFVLTMLASPIVLLILTYWFCILAQLPVNAEYDPTIPYEIKEAYNAGLKVKNNRFRLARVLTLVSALMLSLALFSLSFVDKKVTHSFDAEYSKSDSILIISGVFPKGLAIETKVDSITSSKNRTTFFQNKFTIQENEILSLNIPLKKQPKETIISVTWRENKKEKGMVRTIKKSVANILYK